MIKDFFIKKENIVIIIIGIVSIFFIALGFLFLFFKDNSKGPQIIPTSISEIKWTDLKSNIIDQKITYPKHLVASDHETTEGLGVTIVEFKDLGFLSYFENETHLSIYPSGLDNPFYYASTQESQFTSASDQVYDRVEYLTSDGDVWAVMLTPVNKFKNWGQPGFIWIQAKIIDRGILCVSEDGQKTVSETCDPFVGERTLYDGSIKEGFIEIGYEIVNRNYFK